jgi:uroporphyrin-III C-methyltransferase
MNELPPSPEPQAAASAAVHPPAAPAEAPAPQPMAESAKAPAGEGIADFVQQPLVIAVVLLTILLATNWWSSHTRIRNLREEMAIALKRNEALTSSASELARAVQEQNKELQVKVGVLESRQSEAQSQQLALEQLYQDLSKNRDDWALSEIEQVLSTASQQLQLSGNVQGALIALQNADRSLSRADKPQFITIRRAIAKDIEKLKGLPSLDLIGVALRIDNVIADVDQLPTMSDDKLPTAPPVKVARAKAAAKAGAKAPVPAEPEHPYLNKVQDLWHDWSSEMLVDMKDLVRVRTVANPEALLMSPGQVYFLRENLKLRLLNARVALLSRNEAAFSSDLAAAQDAIAKYFDKNAKVTVAAQAMLRQVQANNLAIEMPSLADSLNAVRNYKAKP